MIQLIGLDKAFGTRAVLSKASLEVRPGESVALVGANGSGKTTTLRCAVGLAGPARGRIFIDGIDMMARPCDARARLSYLAQRTEFPSTLTVREILQVVADLRGTPVRAIDREIALCHLHGIAGRSVGRLSGGERQRVAIAALFISEVRAYLLDEPATNLDPTGLSLLRDRVAAARDDGCAVLFTTHITAELDELATRVVLLREGHIVPVTQDVASGEQQLSIGIDGEGDICIDRALRGGARRAWLHRGRLQAIVPAGAVGALLERFEHEGARVSSYRTVSALASALDHVTEEKDHHEIENRRSVDRCVAAGRLWRGAAWARVGAPGPR